MALAADCHPLMTGKRNALDWEDVRCFAALARHGAVASTARALEVPNATVRRRLARFEAKFGVPLFVARKKGLALTSTGVVALAEAAQMEMAACSLAQMCTGTFSGTVTGAPARSRRSSRGLTGRESS